MKRPINNYRKAILAFTTGFINYRNCILTETKRLFIAITILALLSPVAQAETLFTNGNINVAGSWTNGLPASGNIGTIAVDGWNGTTVFGFGSGSIVNKSAGTITSSDGFNLQSGTWNLSDGKFVTRYFLVNGSSAIVNVSGGSVALADVGSTQHMGVSGGGKLNISGSAFLDGTNATTVVQTSGGTIDIASDWTGSWYWNTYSGNKWQDHFTSGQIKMDGSAIDATAFSLAFFVSDSGKKLNPMVMGSETTTFTGGDVRIAGSWTNGLPAVGKVGNIAVDGIIAASLFGFGGGAVANQSAGTITSSGTEGFNFNQGDTWNLQGGKIVSRYLLANGSSSIINLSGGIVELADVTGNQDIGVANGATMTISGTVILDGTHASKELATNGTLDIASNWSGSWRWGTYSGSEWQNHFTSAQIKLDGSTLDASQFEAWFDVTDEGKTLALNPQSTFLGGSLTDNANWDIGKPTSSIPGVITNDGFISISEFGFGGGTIITQTDGIITSSGTEGFNFNQGDTWNLQGGKIVSRYLLANGSSSIINLSGGIVELADVTGNQDIGVANGATMTISGTVILDGTHASKELATNGTLDIASDWTGSWTWSTYSGSDWQNHFTSGQITLDSNVIDAAEFNSFFRVSNGGKTLSTDPPPGTIILIQ